MRTPPSHGAPTALPTPYQQKQCLRGPARHRSRAVLPAHGLSAAPRSSTRCSSKSACATGARAASAGRSGATRSTRRRRRSSLPPPPSTRCSPPPAHGPADGGRGGRCRWPGPRGAGGNANAIRRARAELSLPDGRLAQASARSRPSALGLELTACGCAASLGMVAGQLRPAARRKDTDRASLASGQNQLSRTIADRDASCKGWESWISGQGRGFGRASWREGQEAGSRSGWRPCPTSFLACRWPQLPPRSCRRAQNAGARPLQCGANLSGRYRCTPKLTRSSKYICG